MSSDSESDAPQAITLAKSKNTARGRQRDIETFRAAEKSKLKERNRLRDRHLKERAVIRGGTKGKERLVKEAGSNTHEHSEEGKWDKDHSRLEARMARAVDEAEGELDESEEEGESGMAEEDDEDVGSEHGIDEEDGTEEGGSESANDLDEDQELVPSDNNKEVSSEEDAFMDSEQEYTLPPSSKYLPDHLFTSAFAKSSPALRTSSQTKPTNTQKALKKRKRVNNKPKDVVLGTRTIRVLPSNKIHTDSYTSIRGTVAPPVRIDRFLSRALALKGGKKAQGWGRKPANVGVFRRDSGAPIAGFVRSR
ncbi:hypothetical protein HETIRDRAFT_423215 [Heterobasidion irregulare TC 32-1]|uniref:Uncharacterized protein n=1 Tax=Heterobasidion irregulare (strain TC 32-1) TaxID=747525 RepID=W4JPU9_HETIT|nr:uncharacterized protein HETIRDRAFT_423215 [Heterobasidion irregulare TC 32-1]ETW75558.1 hypothetical protein HETIRDRAFT_423215 [Heterobasidion irregulare TC 32-1]